MRNLPRAHLNGDDNKDKNFGLSRSRIRILYMYSAQTRQGHDVPIPTWGNLDFAESGAFSSVATPPMYTTTLRVLGGSR